MNKEDILGYLLMVLILSFLIFIPVFLCNKQLENDNNYQGMHYEIKYSNKPEADGKFIIYIMDYDHNIKHKLSLEQYVNITFELGDKIK